MLVELCLLCNSLQHITKMCCSSICATRCCRIPVYHMNAFATVCDVQLVHDCYMDCYALVVPRCKLCCTQFPVLCCLAYHVLGALSCIASAVPRPLAKPPDVEPAAIMLCCSMHV
jgi:hypothetical protein